MADVHTQTTTFNGFKRPEDALCMHVLAAIHVSLGGIPDAVTALHTYVVPLRLAATRGKHITQLCRLLADVQDDVTRNYIITQHVNSSDHDVCPVLEDILVSMIDMVGKKCTYDEVTHYEGFHIPPLQPETPLTVSDVFTYAHPVQQIVAHDKYGNMPVCIDTTAICVLKKISVMLCLTSYHAPYQAAMRKVEERCEALTLRRAGNAEYSSALFEFIDTCLWVCMKCSLDQLVLMAQLVDADKDTWRRDVIDVVYDAFKFMRMPGSDTTESTQNEYLMALLEILVYTRYKGEKLRNPTNDQQRPYMYIMLLQMRDHREMRLMHHSSASHHQNVLPDGWQRAQSIPPFSISDVFEATPLPAVILESSHHDRTCLVARTSEGFAIVDAVSGTIVTVSAGGSVDSCALDLVTRSLWRARAIHIVPDVSEISTRTHQTMTRLFREAGLQCETRTATDTCSVDSDANSALAEIMDECSDTDV